KKGSSRVAAPRRRRHSASICAIASTPPSSDDATACLPSPFSCTSVPQHRLAQVTRRIDLAAARDGNLVCEELERHHGEDGHGHLVRLRNGQDPVSPPLEIRSEEHT